MPETLTKLSDKDTERRRKRWKLLGAAWRVSSLPRLRACRRRRVGTDRTVSIVNGEGGAHYTGLQTCGSVWACAICSAKIRTGRAEEIQTVVEGHLATEGVAYFVTLTTRHGLGDDLGQLWSVVTDSWREVISGRRWLDFTEDYGTPIAGKLRIGLIRSLEVTHGVHGWHPHLHVIVLARDVDEETVRRYLTGRWSRAIGRRTGRTIHPTQGVTVSPITTAGEAAQYIVKEQDGRKVGSEMARHDLKVGRRHGRTPLQLLESAHDDGDADDLARWWHYETVSKGRQAITFSRGLRDEYALPEVTDDELAAAPDPGELVCVLSEQQWKIARQTAGGMVSILEAAEKKGAQGVLDTLDALAVWLAGQPPGT